MATGRRAGPLHRYVVKFSDWVNHNICVLHSGPFQEGSVMHPPHPPACSVSICSMRAYAVPGMSSAIGADMASLPCSPVLGTHTRNSR